MCLKYSLFCDFIIYIFSTIPVQGVLRIEFNTTGCQDNNNYIRFLEHVHARITITHTRRGDLSIHLTSPKGTRSNLLPERPRDYSREGFDQWDFMTTHAWGEDPTGTWVLEIKNSKNSQNTGMFSFFIISFSFYFKKIYKELEVNCKTKHSQALFVVIGTFLPHSCTI